MVILFIVLGAFYGAVAATIAIWSGGTILFALLCYSLFGSLGALATVLALYMRNAHKGGSSNWADGQKGKQPVSA